MRSYLSLCIGLLIAAPAFACDKPVDVAMRVQQALVDIDVALPVANLANDRRAVLVALRAETANLLKLASYLRGPGGNRNAKIAGTGKALAAERIADRIMTELGLPLPVYSKC